MRNRHRRQRWPRPVRRVPRKQYADMRVRELTPGVWAIVEIDYERTVISGFASHADAWAWLDAHTDDGRKARDAHHRIRMAFAGHSKSRGGGW